LTHPVSFSSSAVRQTVYRNPTPLHNARYPHSIPHFALHFLFNVFIIREGGVPLQAAAVLFLIDADSVKNRKSPNGAHSFSCACPASRQGGKERNFMKQKKKACTSLLLTAMVTVCTVFFTAAVPVHAAGETALKASSQAAASSQQSTASSAVQSSSSADSVSAAPAQ
jgi:hypothetical protein